MIQAFGIGCTLLLLIALAIAVYKGVPILVASPICGALCLLCNGMPVMEGMKEAYIGEAAGFFKTWFLFFLAGAILGKIMERSGAAASIARFIIDKCGTGMAIPAVVIACGVLMMAASAALWWCSPWLLFRWSCSARRTFPVSTSCPPSPWAT